MQISFTSFSVFFLIPWILFQKCSMLMKLEKNMNLQRKKKLILQKQILLQEVSLQEPNHLLHLNQISVRTFTGTFFIYRFSVYFVKKVLTKPFLQGNFLLRRLPNLETMRSAIKDVNDCYHYYQLSHRNFIITEWFQNLLMAPNLKTSNHPKRRWCIDKTVQPQYVSFAWEIFMKLKSYHATIFFVWNALYHFWIPWIYYLAPNAKRNI